MTEDVVKETGERWMDPHIPTAELQGENATLKRLVVSMALAIPRDCLPADEREALDEALIGYSDDS